MRNTEQATAQAILAVVRKPILPEFYGSVFEHYATNYINRNLWRVSAYLGEFEDALSTACWCYYDTRKRYGATVNSLAHLMSLYKRALACWFADYSNSDTKYRSVLPEKDVEPVIQSSANLAAALADASKELRSVLDILMNASQDLLMDLRKDIKKTVDDDTVQCQKVFKRATILAGLPVETAPELQRELMELLS